MGFRRSITLADFSGPEFKFVIFIGGSFKPANISIHLSFARYSFSDRVLPASSNVAEAPSFPRGSSWNLWILNGYAVYFYTSKIKLQGSAFVNRGRYHQCHTPWNINFKSIRILRLTIDSVFWPAQHCISSEYRLWTHLISPFKNNTNENWRQILEPLNIKIKNSEKRTSQKCPALRSCYKWMVVDVEDNDRE